MRRTMSVMLGVVLAGSTFAMTTETASAANKPGKVAVKKIENRTAPHGKKVTIKSRASHSGQVRAGKPTLTVKQGKKVKVRNKRSARLRPGTYSVTSRVRYRTFVYRTRQVGAEELAYRVGSTVEASCTVGSATPTQAGASFTASCTGGDFNGTFAIAGTGTTDGSNEWLLTPGGAVTAGLVPSSLVGHGFVGQVETTRNLYTRVYTPETYRRYSSLRTKTRKQTLKIHKQVRLDPGGSWNCPSWAPIKGNANSGIYHVPSGSFYKRTKPEECFATEKAARDAGYRKSKV